MNSNIEKAICVCFTALMILIFSCMSYEAHTKFLLNRQTNEIIKEAISKDYSSDQIKGLLNYQKEYVK
jgi:hypothetical protein